MRARILTVMQFNPSEYPLQRFPLFRTSSADEFRAAVHAVYGATHVEVSKTEGFGAWANFVQLEQIALGFAGCTAKIALGFPEVDYARQQFAISGIATTTTSGVTTTIDSQSACTTSLGRPMSVDCDAGHERLTLRIKTAALDQKLAMLLGANPKGSLEFEPAVMLAHPPTQGLVQLIMFLSEQINAETTQLPALALREMEQAVIVHFLSANRHAYSPQLERQMPDVASGDVRMAEEYIEAHWKEAITIERLVQVTGASSRALFRSFRRTRGYSPMAFAKMVRLRRARELLLSADENSSVTGIAFACGFLGTGHFAKDYRDAFGELPSETLARGRGDGP